MASSSSAPNPDQDIETLTRSLADLSLPDVSRELMSLRRRYRALPQEIRDASCVPHAYARECKYTFSEDEVIEETMLAVAIETINEAAEQWRARLEDGEEYPPHWLEDLFMQLEVMMDRLRTGVEAFEALVQAAGAQPGQQ